MALLWSLFVPAVALAGTGDVATSPMAGVPARQLTSKLQMTVDPVWVEACGYRPVRIKLTNMPPVPATADRNFTLEVSPIDWNYYTDQLRVQGALTIPQGNASAQTTISVPVSGQWNGLRIAVFEDGRRLDDMKLDMSLASIGANFGSTNFPSFLVIDGDAPTRDRRAHLKQMNYFLGQPGGRPASTYDLPDVRVLASLNPYSNSFFNNSQVDDITLLQQMYHMPSLELLPPNDLPEKWLDYSCFDVAAISLSELKSLAANHPKRFAALRDFVAAGASLVVFGVGKEFESLKDLEQALSMPAVDPDSKWGPARGWSTPNRNSFNTRFNLASENDRYNYNYGRRWANTAVPGMPVGPGGATPAAPEGYMFDPNTGQMVPDPNYSPPSDRVAKLPELRVRPLQMGRVVATSSENLFAGATDQTAWNDQQANWSWISQTIGKGNLIWQSRHGVSVTSDNQDYWNFLIPGVGMAPVTGFRILISLFVILIGPVNYLLLWRWKRLYLLLVTVPAGAAAITLCLLGYALVTDGLGVRARVRSFTHLDQRSGSAVSWSRQSYYAGLAPSRGLAYPDDAAVYRILDWRSDSGNSNRNLIWTERRQNLRKGYLNSRITGQFLVVRSHHKSPAHLEVTEPTENEALPHVENLLGTKIRQLALCDSDGKWHWGENLEPGETLELTPRVPVESFNELRETASEFPLLEPPGFNPSAYGYGSSWNRRNRYYNYRGNSGLTPSLNSSLLEIELRMATAGGSISLAPRTYVAIVERSPEVPLGVESAREESSLHVVVGQW